MIRIGILGCGGIARKMANTLRLMKQNGEDVCLYAAAARDEQKAQAFAAAEGFQKAYGSYEALAQDEQVDLIYIATPHSHHYEHMLLCITHRKPVLCEKSFALNAAQAREILSLAKKNNVFVCEAMWTRFLPFGQILRELIQSGKLGDVQYVSADLHWAMEDIDRIRLPELAGGALLDIGVYSLNMAFMALGTGFERMETSVQLTPAGLDRQESISLYYPDGAMAQLTAGIAACGANRAVIAGTKGSLMVDNIFNPQSLTLCIAGQEAVPVSLPAQLTGYEYEVRACMQALNEGGIESPVMPHAETIRVMEIMDELRRLWGVAYPQEKTIYLAGGCYWGVEKYLSNIPGVISTEVGFANGSTHHPTYQQVRYENTGHAETVRVTYDERMLPADKLLRLFFRIIDPVSVNKQGEDEGTQYRTGIYFTDAAHEATARAELAKLSAQFDQPLAVECCRLDHFYTAEEYHQRYLDKNPTGYCHVPWAAINAVKNVDLSQV